MNTVNESVVTIEQEKILDLICKKKKFRFLKNVIIFLLLSPFIFPTASTTSFDL